MSLVSSRLLYMKDIRLGTRLSKGNTVMIRNLKSFSHSLVLGLYSLRKSSSLHSTCLNFHQKDMYVKLIPALSDNYMYLLVDKATNECAAVDPVEPEKLIDAVNREGFNLTKVLTTHHHWDHAGGNEQLSAIKTGLTFYGGDDRIAPSSLNKVSHGDEFQIGKLNVKCLFTPCHTSGHICYYITGEPEEAPAVFTGDTLFQGGCGRFFEGNPEQMNKALNEILASLPANTKVYCGHEYTVSNLKYGLHVDPQNLVIKDRLQWAISCQKEGKPTIPSTIEEEMSFNPFMRVSSEAVKKHTGQTDPIAVMSYLRKEKDDFKPPSSL